jgi:6-phosphofructo-2-kinase/fructose-2,6-biphosphatase 4
MNIHNRSRTIYLARAGEALIEHLYKADADLSSLGWEYADRLAEFLETTRKAAAERSIKAANEGRFTGRDEPGSGPGEEGRNLEVRDAARRWSLAAHAFCRSGPRRGGAPRTRRCRSPSAATASLSARS